MSWSGVLGGEGGAGERPCLLVVDATIAFTDPSSPLCCEADDAITANARLIDAARAAGVPVIFSAVVLGEHERTVAEHFLRKLPGLLSIADDPRRSEIDPRIAPREGELVIEKIFPSVFFDTELDAVLSDGGIDTVIVTGMSTSGCVRATAVDALQHGYRPLVAREAVADRDAVAHENALRDLQLKYADVIGVDAIVDYLERVATKGTA